MRSEREIDVGRQRHMHLHIAAFSPVPPATDYSLEQPHQLQIRLKYCIGPRIDFGLPLTLLVADDPNQMDIMMT